MGPFAPLNHGSASDVSARKKLKNSTREMIIILLSFVFQLTRNVYTFMMNDDVGASSGNLSSRYFRGDVV